MRTTKEFLSDLYGGCTDGCITITTLPNRISSHIPVAEIARAAEEIEKLGRRTNTYYNMALRRPGLDSYTRGDGDDIHAVVCMYADIDVKGGAHKQQNLPETMEEAIQFVRDLPMEPSYLISSGNGLHAIWLLEEPFVIHSPDDLKRIRAVSAGFGAYLVQKGQEHGWRLDNVQDIERMLRAPGTLNFKTDPPRPCTILEYNPVRYPLSTFEGYKIEVKEPEKIEVDPGIIGPAERMQGRCAFIDCCVDEAGSLPEPWWHGMISIVALTEDGQEKCHEWSEPYYNYDPDQTDERVKRALKEKKPCSCEYISRAFGFPCPAGGCQNNGRTVRGPIAFAIYSKEEQAEKLLEEKISIDEAMDEKALRLVAYARDEAPALYVKLKKKYQKMGISVRDLEKSISAVAQTTAKEEFFGALHLEGINAENLKLPENWELTMDGLKHMVLTNMGVQIVPVTASPVLLTKKIEDLNDGSEKLEISFFRNHRWKRLLIPRGDVMDKGKLVKYANGGLPVSTGNSQSLVQFFASFEAINADTLAYRRSIDRMGWAGRLKEFYPYHMKDEVVFENESAEASRLVKSIRKEGSEEAWLAMAVKLRTMPFARTMLAASFASVLLEPLRQRIIYLHLWKDSRSGKTACEKAAISVWGDPAGLMVSYNSTQVGFERTAAAMNYMPLALDELQSSTMKSENFSKVVYMLANGIGKVRGEKFGGTQELLHWKNVILSTGEQPIIVGNSMDGIVTRILELAAAPIKDETFSSEVHRISEANFGFAGEKFVNWIYKAYLDKKDGEETLREEYESFKNDLDIMYDICYADTPAEELDKAAVVAFADFLSSRAVFGLEEKDAHTDAIGLGCEILKNIQSREQADSIDRAWDYVVDWTRSNKHHFEVKKRLGGGFDKAALSPVYGRYYPEEGKVCFIPSCLYGTLTDGGFSVEKCYTGFKERGYIDQVQKKVRLDGNNPKTIGAYIELDLKPWDAQENDFLS